MSQNQQWNEATEQMGKMIRWEQAEVPGKETLYLGPVLQGIYTKRKEDVGQNASTVYEVTLANGEIVSFWGSALLDGKFNQIAIGSEVRVTYLGVEQPKTPGGRPYRNFKVEFAKPVTTMVEPGAVAAAQPVPMPAQPAAPVAPVAPAYAAPTAAAPVAAPAQPVAPAAPAIDQGY